MLFSNFGRSSLLLPVIMRPATYDRHASGSGKENGSKIKIRDDFEFTAVQVQSAELELLTSNTDTTDCLTLEKQSRSYDF